VVFKTESSKSIKLTTISDDIEVFGLLNQEAVSAEVKFDDKNITSLLKIINIFSLMLITWGV